MTKAFAGTLKEKIFTLTGEAWIIEVKEGEDHNNGMSLEEKRQKTNDDIQKRFLALSTVKELLQKFPQAQVKVEA